MLLRTIQGAFEHMAIKPCNINKPEEALKDGPARMQQQMALPESMAWCGPPVARGDKYHERGGGLRHSTPKSKCKLWMHRFYSALANARMLPTTPHLFQRNNFPHMHTGAHKPPYNCTTVPCRVGISPLPWTSRISVRPYNCTNNP
jgi:hypothetical protein